MLSVIHAFSHLVLLSILRAKYYHSHFIDEEIEIPVNWCPGPNHTARVQEVCVASKPALKAVPPHCPLCSEHKYGLGSFSCSDSNTLDHQGHQNPPERWKTIKGPIVSCPHLHLHDRGSTRVPWLPPPGTWPALTLDTQSLAHTLQVSWFSELQLTPEQGMCWLLPNIHILAPRFKFNQHWWFTNCVHDTGLEAFRNNSPVTLDEKGLAPPPLARWW